jgi:signal transduction histidine kinase/CheY-like chemotaxis protein
MRPAWRYFVWISATMSAIATASAAGHALLVWKHSQAALGRAHSDRIVVVRERVNSWLADLHRELLEALAEIDATLVADRDRRRAELFRLLRQERALVRLVLLDASGQVETQIDRLRPEGQDAAATVPQQAADLSDKTAGMRVVSTFLYKDVQPRALMVARRTAASARTLVAESTLAALDDLLLRIASGPGEYAYMVDRAGNVIAQSDSLRHGAPPPRVANAVSASSAESSDHALLLQPVTTSDGRSVVASRAEVSGLGAWLVLETDADVAHAPLRKSLYTGAAIVAASLLAALALSSIIARRIARPIRTIEQGAEHVGAGQYDLRLDPAAHRELAPLARALNAMAAQIGASHARLEQRVDERTVELARAKEHAEAADRAKTRFLAAASHDLRQPLHTVGILATLLARRAHGDELTMLTARLQTAVQTLEEFFTSLLDLSRLDAAQVAIARKRVELGPLLMRMRERYAAGDSAGRLRVAASRLAVESDPVLLERMVQNLLGNALEHASAGRVLLGVRRRGGRAHIEVHDQGAGVRPELREQIFEEFYRAPAQDAPPGLGLGLAIVRRFAQLLGHAVAVRDSPLGGACFSIELPIAGSACDGAVAAHADTAHTELDNVFVLLIEDDPGVLRWTERLFADSGCHVVSAVSATAAEAALARHLRTPDVILSDYHFAGQADGFEAVVALRDRLDAAMPIVLVSGDVEALQRANVDARIAKPADPAELLAAVATVVGARSPAPTR